MARISGSCIISVGNGWDLMGGRGLMRVVVGLGGFVNGIGGSLMAEVVAWLVD